MNTPTCRKILEAMHVNPTIFAMADESPVEISVLALKVLFRHIALLNYGTDEEYIACNEDVGQAFERGDVTDVRAHFIEVGFFEGRKARNVDVDENWYLNEYPDVKMAISSGAIESAESHFNQRGEIEWRAPDANSEISYSMIGRLTVGAS
ncbi:hypothetical protein [Sediminicoccus sp. KRV36]|uniref:hypothetical protein n=1 Tax=Sediminicoccus sp. KRV36 TaxID=3133721 RepID=UPI0020101F43|nr:hypothetical protein [Sediminicoccus rosea]UPY36025.1 hypothetical protein LHU95_17645 [Sediminicoccus rosea]